jgi:hypothetical protein
MWLMPKGEQMSHELNFWISLTANAQELVD